MHQLEPTYLHYIYDGLVKGSIHPENAAELPDGLIGMYEEAFDERISVVERQKLLQRFAIWALLKKEVSAAFVAEVLGETEDDIQDFISNYSAWFNSPESGKYQLYHERLKVYLLQKLNNEAIKLSNRKIIYALKLALKRKKIDDLNYYGLQFLGYHLIIETTLTRSFDDFVNNCLNTNYIDRQINVSDAFDWSKEAIKGALKLAAFYKEKNIVFKLSKSLVILNAKEKLDLGKIQKLLDTGEDALVLTKLNSIIDGTKENYTTSYAFQILSIAYLMDKGLSINIERRVKLFIENIENNIPDNRKVVDQFLLIPDSITLKLLVDLKNIGRKPDFILKRCSSINFSKENLKKYNVKDLKYLHELVGTHYHDFEIHFLVCAANCVIHQNKNADYFFKIIEDKLEKNRTHKDSFLNNTSYDYNGYELIPEEIIKKTKNRRIINYCCEKYLSYGINKYSKKLYKEKFKIKEIDDLKDLFPFPEINLNKLFDLDELKEISKKLADSYIIDNKCETTDENKNLQEKVISCLVNDYDFELKKLNGILEKYELKRFSSIINPYGTHVINWGQTFGLSMSQNIHPKMNQKNICFIQNFIESENKQDSLKWEKNENIQLNCYVNICTFLNKEKDIDDEKIYNIIISNLRQIEEYDKNSYRNFETFEIIQFLFFQGFKLKLVLELIKSSKFKGTAIDLYRYLICYYFVENNLKKATLILELLKDLENNTKCSLLTYDFLDFFQTKNVKINIGAGHFDFLNKLLELKKLDSESKKFKHFKLIVLMSINSKDLDLNSKNNLDKLVIEKLSEFNTSLWKYLAIKYYCEKSCKDVTQILSLYQDYGIKNIKVKSEDINSFVLQFKLPTYINLSSKTMKKKVVLHCIKNNLVDYFLSNEIYKEPLFSDDELFNFFSCFLNQQNIRIFYYLIESIENASLPLVQNFNLLFYKNELYHFLRLNSLDTSRISFAYHDGVVESGFYPSENIAIKAIKCFDNVNSLEVLKECIEELEDIEDDIVNWDTGDVIDGNEEKVKSLCIIVRNLWKIGENKLARQQLESALKFYNQMVYETEKKTWVKKLNNLAMTVLRNEDLELYLKEKVQINKYLSVEIIDSIFKNNFSNIIKLIFAKAHIDRSIMEHMVNAYVRFHSLDKAFLYVKQINNPAHANAWKNIVIEKVYSIGNDFDGTIAFDKYCLVYYAVESTKALEQMLKYELFSDVCSNSSTKQIISKYDGYLNEGELRQLVKNIL